jgi:hypothetical protein
MPPDLVAKCAARRGPTLAAPFRCSIPTRRGAARMDAPCLKAPSSCIVDIRREGKLNQDSEARWSLR